VKITTVQCLENRSVFWAFPSLTMNSAQSASAFTERLESVALVLDSAHNRRNKEFGIKNK